MNLTGIRNKSWTGDVILDHQFLLQSLYFSSSLNILFQLTRAAQGSCTLKTHHHQEKKKKKSSFYTEIEELRSEKMKWSRVRYRLDAARKNVSWMEVLEGLEWRWCSISSAITSPHFLHLSSSLSVSLLWSISIKSSLSYLLSSESDLHHQPCIQSLQSKSQ